MRSPRGRSKMTTGLLEPESGKPEGIKTWVEVIADETR
jgi:hypothetical protein